MIAFYDLQVSPPTWDYTKFLVRAAMERAPGERIRVNIVPGPRDGFRNDSLPPGLAMRWRMLRNVVMRYGELFRDVETHLCDSRSEAGDLLAQATETVFPSGYNISSPASTYNESLLLHGWRAGLRMPVMIAPAPATEFAEALIPDDWTCLIVLRECSYWPDRNSKLDVWLQFAEWLREAKQRRVIFVRDSASAGWPLGPFECCHLASVDLTILFALLQRAELSYFVVNGPGALAWWSSVPYRTFRWFYTVDGLLPHGSQLPWAHEDQKIIWHKETFDALRASFEEHEKCH